MISCKYVSFVLWLGDALHIFILHLSSTGGLLSDPYIGSPLLTRALERLDFIAVVLIRYLWSNGPDVDFWWVFTRWTATLQWAPQPPGRYKHTWFHILYSMFVSRARSRSTGTSQISVPTNDHINMYVRISTKIMPPWCPTTFIYLFIQLLLHSTGIRYTYVYTSVIHKHPPIFKNRFRGKPKKFRPHPVNFTNVWYVGEDVKREIGGCQGV